ncbi:threonine/serine dehydratase [Hamadaea sp. NPDC050747]|uniref:threonine ammonia-lyase n=1 Tax=Hamadaea sp. NPDC050747 TaxID=3155789 RepID=UPI0033FE1766
MTTLVTLADVRAAADRVEGVVVRTPLLPVPGIGPDLWLKPESLQPTGAFKVRGATNAVRSLPAESLRAGVVTHSSGNHGQALAYAARMAGIACWVVVPEGAPSVKVEAIRAQGAEIVLVPPAQRLPEAERIAAVRGATLVPPFDDPAVIAGQGTLGLEIVADLPDVDVVLVQVGGGGLVSGVAAAVKALSPSARVIGVEPELAAETAEGLHTGTLVPWPVERTYRTIADGVRTSPSELTFAHIQAYVDDIVTVTEEQIRAAVGVLAHQARIVAEPSGALTTAAYLAGKAPGGRTVAIVSGGNADPALLHELLRPSAG